MGNINLSNWHQGIGNTRWVKLLPFSQWKSSSPRINAQYEKGVVFYSLYSGDNCCGLFVLWQFRFVAFRFVAVSVCGLSGLWPFRFVAVSVCGRFGLWPFRLWPFRFVAVMTCYRRHNVMTLGSPLTEEVRCNMFEASSCAELPLQFQCKLCVLLKKLLRV